MTHHATMVTPVFTDFFCRSSCVAPASRPEIAACLMEGAKLRVGFLGLSGIDLPIAPCHPNSIVSTQVCSPLSEPRATGGGIRPAQGQP